MKVHGNNQTSAIFTPGNAFPMPQHPITVTEGTEGPALALLQGSIPAEPGVVVATHRWHGPVHGTVGSIIGSQAGRRENDLGDVLNGYI